VIGKFRAENLEKKARAMIISSLLIRYMKSERRINREEICIEVGVGGEVFPFQDGVPEGGSGRFADVTLFRLK
jgi:hypothetical protein